jgi:hypothetical protein
MASTNSRASGVKKRHMPPGLSPDR